MNNNLFEKSSRSGGGGAPHGKVVESPKRKVTAQSSHASVTVMPNVSCAIRSPAGSGGSGYLETMGLFCEMSAVIGLAIISLSAH